MRTVGKERYNIIPVAGKSYLVDLPMRGNIIIKLLRKYKQLDAIITNNGGG